MSTSSDKRVLYSAALGQFVEWYDFVVYAYSATVIAKLFFPTGNDTTALIASFGVFGAAMVARPIGAIFFGHLGDKHNGKPPSC